MSLYKRVRELWKSPSGDFKKLMKERLIHWAKDPVCKRIERPTRIDRARSLGYKAKKGFILVRYRIKRGGKNRPQLKAGRRSKNMRRNLVLSKNYQLLAEERAQRHFPNLEVLNSYPVGKDKTHYYFEIIFVDPQSRVVKNNKNLGWISKPENRHRVFRGLTSAGKKSRGLRRKGKGAEKVRPSNRANKRRLK